MKDLPTISLSGNSDHGYYQNDTLNADNEHDMEQSGDNDVGLYSENMENDGIKSDDNVLDELMFMPHNATDLTNKGQTSVKSVQSPSGISELASPTTQSSNCNSLSTSNNDISISSPCQKTKANLKVQSNKGRAS